MYSPVIGWEEKLRKIILPEIPKNISLEKIILSFSGGQDSVLSLYSILAIAQEISLRELRLFFLDHGFFSQEVESFRKEILLKHILFAQNYLPKVKILFEPYYRDIAKVAKKLKTSLERAGSLVRHRLLRKMASPNGFIATGHNLSDWLETVILRLNRGSSPLALYPFSTLEKEQDYGYFFPIAHLTRFEVQELLHELEIPYWKDPHNEEKKGRRSQIREVLSFHPDGLRKSRKNFLLDKKNKKIEINLIPKNLKEICQKNYESFSFEDRKFTFFEIKKKRELLFPYSQFCLLNESQKILLCELALREIGLYPLSKTLRQFILEKGKLNYGPFVMERENWGGVLFLVFRRGRAKIFELRDSYFGETKITKKHYICMPYGRKLVSKIFSEYKISKRQRKYIRFVFDPNEPLRVLKLEMEALGISQIKDFYFLKSGGDL